MDKDCHVAVPVGGEEGFGTIDVLECEVAEVLVVVHRGMKRALQGSG